jgi:hypothetical protein
MCLWYGIVTTRQVSLNPDFLFISNSPKFICTQNNANFFYYSKVQTTEFSLPKTQPIIRLFQTNSNFKSLPKTTPNNPIFLFIPNNPYFNFHHSSCVQKTLDLNLHFNCHHSSVTTLDSGTNTLRFFSTLATC